MSDQEETAGPKAGEIAGFSMQQMSDFLLSRTNGSGCHFCGSRELFIHSLGDSDPNITSISVVDNPVYKLKLVYLICRNCSAVTAFSHNVMTSLMYGLKIEDNL